MPYVRHVLSGVREGVICVREASAALDLSRRRVYQLYGDYLRACAQGVAEQWEPGRSGGNHRPAFPEQVEALLRKLLGAKPPLSYGFATSEVHRRLGLELDRATVRRWAIAASLQHTQPIRQPRAAVRRWQCAQVGALWQLDASAHRWFGSYGPQTVLLDMVDDCTRVITGARLYGQETLLAYFDFLPRALEAYGLPLALYVDYHSFFFSQEPEALTQLGHALKFYGITLKYAPTPEAKGKIERQHQFWQNRLPPLFILEKVGQIIPANLIIDPLRLHHNQHEIHREIACTPQAAWQAALSEGRTVLRPLPKCPWWKYIWSLRSTVRVGPDGRVPVGTQRLRVELPPRQPLVRCLHPNGAITILKESPAIGKLPLVVLHYPLQAKVQL